MEAICFPNRESSGDTFVWSYSLFYVIIEKKIWIEGKLYILIVKYNSIIYIDNFNKQYELIVLFFFKTDKSCSVIQLMITEEKKVNR